METIKSPAEQKVILHNVRWETYERLVDERGESRVPRFAYDRGELEIMSPSTEHESTAYFLELLVAIFTEVRNVNVYGVGSTTFRREDLERGFEPDACFYVQNEERIRGKPRIDLGSDPPPDLVIEIDITSPSLNKLSIYARIGVPEVWRHDGERVSILVLRGDRYVEIAESAVLPPLSSSVLSRFVEESRTLGSAAWMRRVREWTGTNVGTAG
jgi:Uma2 family endonuclease